MFKFVFSVPDTELAEKVPTRVTQKDDICCPDSDPYHAVDKKLNTRANVGGDSPWLKLEFDKEHLIHKVVIYFRFYTDWFRPDSNCLTDEDAWKKCVDNANNVDVSVYKDGILVESCGTLRLTYGLKQSDQIYTLVCNTEGNELLLSKTLSGIKIWEIVVIGTGKHQGLLCRFIF